MQSNRIKSVRSNNRCIRLIFNHFKELFAFFSGRLCFNIEYQHLFPHEEDAIRYSTIALLSANLRYQLFSGRLQIQLAINDPFRQNIVKSTKIYNSYKEYVRNDTHSRNVSFKFTYNLGGKKVKSVYKNNKDTESSRGF